MSFLGIAGGIAGNVLGNSGGGEGGMLGGLGEIGSKLLDPMGLLGGNGNQAEGDMSSEQMMEEFKNMLDDFLKELMSQISDTMGTNVDTGSGDDTVNVGESASGGSEISEPQSGPGAGPGSSPININTGPGDDVVNIGIPGAE
jgi:hypothetical protein